MFYKNVMLICDNFIIFNKIYESGVINKTYIEKFDFRYSYDNLAFIEGCINKELFKPINIENDIDNVTTKYDLIISLHCRKIFPKELIRQVKCINIHPGYIPYNRGWYPHVFSLINGLPCGATIHEMTDLIDYGPIIARKKVDIECLDTSETLYGKILEAEVELIKENLEIILNNDYETFNVEKGNLNTKKDYENIKFIDIKQSVIAGDIINKLRALTHGEYNNAYFINENGEKVYVSIKLEKETT